MMKENKVILYIAVSMDGFIARLDGAVDWLDEVEGDGDNGYAKFYESVGTVVMGRGTYDAVKRFPGEFHYKGKPCYVYTRKQMPDDPDVTFTDEPVEDLIPRLKAASEGHVWLVGGGLLLQAFLEHKLLDELQIYTVPHVLGEGIPLFPEGSASEWYTLTDLKKMGSIAAATYIRKS
ncbi:dihydrofolate reductase family protein [Paenibacillus gansuensis]|uniref:Dihydrofolate reductase family protein n=1 Tax=Paenibacillus gansuensis TaxID=306542 RepID=A0ABW5PE27_9BACL